jgi:hypothetical protein
LRRRHSFQNVAAKNPDKSLKDHSRPIGGWYLFGAFRFDPMLGRSVTSAWAASAMHSNAWRNQGGTRFSDHHAEGRLAPQ